MDLSRSPHPDAFSSHMSMPGSSPRQRRRSRSVPQSAGLSQKQYIAACG